MLTSTHLTKIFVIPSIKKYLQYFQYIKKIICVKIRQIFIRKRNLKICLRFYNSSLSNDFMILASNKNSTILSNFSNYSNLFFNEVIVISTTTQKMIDSKRFLG